MDSTLEAFDAARLLDKTRIQGFHVTYLHAVLDTTSHFVGHTHQIVYITRVRLGNRYAFEWKPAGKEQGAE